MRSHALTSLLAILTVASSCAPRDELASGPTGGTLIVATVGDADALLPPLIGNVTGKQFVDMTFAGIATPKDEINVYGDAGYAPALADRWEWAADSLAITFHIRSDARWHDGKPVTASDIRYSLAAYTSPAVAAIASSFLANIDSISVRDSATFVVWFRTRSATQFHEFAYNLIPFPEHVYGRVPLDSLRASPIARTVVGSGKFRFVRWEPNVHLEVIADTGHWGGRPRLDRVVWRTYGTALAAAGALKTGEVDLVEFLRGPTLDLVQGDSAVQLVPRPELSFGMVTFNLRDAKEANRPHPILAERGMRRALSLAVDRLSLVRNILDTLGTTMASPYLDFQRIESVTLLPFDTAASNRLLDSLGWRDQDGDGIRDRRGRRLELSVMAPTSSQPRVRAATILQEVWRRVGVSVFIAPMEPAAMGPALGGGKFDVALTGFTGDPSPSFIRQPFGTGSPQTFGKYSNATFDAITDSAVSSPDSTAARAAYARAGQVLADDPPGIWLYQAIAIAGMHRRIRPATMRVDAWWANLDRWSIATGQEIDRDRIGLQTPTKN